MRGFVVLTGDLASPLARAVIQAAARTRGAQGWSRAVLEPDLAVYVRGPCPPPVHLAQTRDGLLIGDVFATDRSTPMCRPLAWAGLAPGQIFRRLTDDLWGRYVALARRDGAWAAYRDPSGALECFTWRRDGLTVFASDLTPWLTASLPRGAAVDDDRLALLIGAPTAMYGASAIQGVTALAPGQSLIGGDLRQVWAPAMVARQGTEPAATAERRLREVVVDAVGSLAGLGGVIGAEISGGLDSSIVAAAITAMPQPPVSTWLNFYIDEPLGDERRYASAVAEHLGLALTVFEKPEGRFDPRRQLEHGLTFRPPTSGVDQAYDRMIADQARSLGLDRLVSGQGGDTVFLHAPVTGIVRDLVRDRGRAALLTPALVDLARWTRRSVWSLAREALTRDGPSDLPGWRPMAFAGEAVRDLTPTMAPHPWLEDLEGLTPAKRFQVYSLSLSQRLNTAAGRTRHVDCLHPLLSQPVMTWSLRTSAIDLTRGGRDRALARQAFSADLPPAVVARRSKGDGTAWFGRMVEASLPTLRPLLLEGELARRGLIDRVQLEAMLTPDYLVWNAGYPQFLDAAAIELWVKGWLDRAPQADLAAAPSS